MVFSSVIFLFLFLPVVLAVNFLLPFRFRNLFLLVASLLFYAWGESFYVLIMLGSITGNYVFGRWIENASSKSRKRRLITAAVALNLALLIAFKYANFIATNLDLVFAAAGLPTIDLRPIHLPIGISFFTFQAMSYVVDVYRGHVRAQRRLVDLALYIALFPQLIAGPIVRYIDVAKEIVSRRTSWADFATGVRIFIVGLGKKILIANIVAAQCDRIFAIPAADLPAGVAWIGLTCFFFQIYFDFSGYSDMAIGLGRMFGFHFLPNFNYPYISKSLTEFWQRWHISLSTWFRDYLFQPLGGYRCSRARAYLNLMAVFFLCGFWHGASWNFILFGVHQGIFLIFERVIRAKRRWFFSSLFGNVYFLVLIFTSMVFFRTDNLRHAWSFFAAIFGATDGKADVYQAAAYLPLETLVALAVAVIASTPVLPWIDEKLKGAEGAPGRELLRQAAALAGCVAVLVLCCMKLAAGTHNPFIYFRF